MEILSHRGYWTQAAEKNTPAAFTRSFNLGYGTETDVRDRSGELVISHDPPTAVSGLLAEFLAQVARRNLPLALNVKADGLAAMLRAELDAAGIETAFVFDMSVPDMRAYFSAGIPVFTRLSEVERDAIWLDKAVGVWLDGFQDLWYDRQTIERLLDSGKRVCVVSPELHGRSRDACWELLEGLASHPGLMLCTDYPEDATVHFGGSA